MFESWQSRGEIGSYRCELDLLWKGFRDCDKKGTKIRIPWSTKFKMQEEEEDPMKDTEKELARDKMGTRRASLKANGIKSFKE